MRGGPTYEKERISVNLARLKKGGETFEVVVDPDLAVQYKQNPKSTDIRKVLQAEHIYADARKGELASEQHMGAVFETKKPLEVADIILQTGEIQLTHEHRERIRETKRNKIIHTIHLNAINPQTKTVHPKQRIESALEEARFRVNEYKKAEEQIQDAISAIRPIIPITFTTFIADIHLPAEHAAASYSILKQYGTMTSEQWLSDGSLAVKVELPAGRYNELVDELASKTHGSVEITKTEK